MNGFVGPNRRSSKQTDVVLLSGCFICIVSSKFNTPFILNVVSLFHVDEYHIPPLVVSQERVPSIGMRSISVESPGIPCSLKISVCCDNIIICEDMSSRSMEPSNSSIIGSIETNIKPIIETTPPNNNTVAIAADTDSSFLVRFCFISPKPPD